MPLKTTLREAVQRYVSMAPEVFARLESVAERRQLERGEHLLREGHVAQHLYFVEQGMLRYYYLVDGQEHTGQFFFPGIFVSDIASFTRQQPALQNIDALEASTIVLLPRLALLKLYDAEPTIERFGRRLVEEALAYSQLRTASFMRETAEERYRALVRQRPRVMERVPLYMVASYLGITPEALSRIRRRVEEAL
ncbi:MAG: Crp/Fnr family transcriptional regulator [Rhodothermales bacterium]